MALPCTAKPRGCSAAVCAIGGGGVGEPSGASHCQPGLAARRLGFVSRTHLLARTALRYVLATLLPQRGRDSYPNGTRQLAGSAELGATRLAEYSPVRPQAGAAQTNPR